MGGGSWSQSVNCHVAVNGVAQEQGVKCTGNYTVQWGSVTGVATGTYPCMAWSFGRGGVAIIAKLFQDLPRHKGHHVSHAGRGNAKGDSHGRAGGSSANGAATPGRRYGDLASSSVARFKRAE